MTNFSILTATTSILESGRHSTSSFVPMSSTDSYDRRCRTMGTHGCKQSDFHIRTAWPHYSVFPYSVVGEIGHQLLQAT